MIWLTFIKNSLKQKLEYFHVLFWENLINQFLTYKTDKLEISYVIITRAFFNIGNFVVLLSI